MNPEGALLKEHPLTRHPTTLLTGNVILFDLGMAIEFTPSQADANGCYKMTACTGTPRYMPPEVALGKPYNETVDVYSFGLLLYQILSLEPPFEGLTIKSFPKIVYEKGGRPVVDKKWPVEISSLIQSCWSQSIRDRPSMARVTSVLSKELDGYGSKSIKTKDRRHCNGKQKHCVAPA